MDSSSESENGENTRKILRRFIEMYESLPQLWNTSHPLYKCKTNRSTALNRLVPLYAQIVPGATRKDVTKKINTLRTNFRSDLKRVRASEQSGGRIYKPKAWTFHALQFLRDNEQPAVADATPGSDWMNDTYQNEPECQLMNSASAVSSPSIYSQDHYITSEDEDPLPPKTKRQKASTQSRSDLVPAIAVAWGEKLMTLEQTQRLYAEKIINDVLFEASFGNLDRSSLSMVASYSVGPAAGEQDHLHEHNGNEG